MILRMLFAFLLSAPLLAGDLLRAEFRDPAALGVAGAPLTAGGEVAVRDGAAWIGAGGSLTSRVLLGGDVQLDLDVAWADPVGEALLSLGGGACRCVLRHDAESIARVSMGDRTAQVTLPAADRWQVRLRNRGGGVELSVNDGEPITIVQTQALAGGRLELTATVGRLAIASLVVTRLVWFDGVQVRGASPEQIGTLRALPAEHFELLAPAPARLDPVYQLAVRTDPVSAPLVLEIRHCGLRVEDAIPLLDQALALADIRPYLRFRVLEGDGKAGVIAPIGGDGVCHIAQPPGVIEVFALTTPSHGWPAVTAFDDTNDRLLDRCVPTGPARRNVSSEIPPDCDRLRIELFVPGSDKSVHFIEVARPD